MCDAGRAMPSAVLLRHSDRQMFVEGRDEPVSQPWGGGGGPSLGEVEESGESLLCRGEQV